MSKSLGNVIAPQKVADTLGAEIMRLWVAAHRLLGRAVARRTRSSSAWSRATAASATRCASCWPILATSIRSSDAVPVAECWRSTAMRWRMMREVCSAHVSADYERYEFHPVVARLQTFCSEDLGALLSRHPEGPAVHDAARIRRRAARRRPRCGIITRHAAAPDGADAVVHGGGGVDRSFRQHDATAPSSPQTYATAAGGAGRGRSWSNAGLRSARCGQTCTKRLEDAARTGRDRLVAAGRGRDPRRRSQVRAAAVAG